MLRSGLPALRAQPFPGSHRRQRPDNRRLLPLPACFHPQDTEAAVVVVESDALDQTGDFLGRGPTLWDYGIHAWGFIFPWTAVACVTSQEAPSAGIWLPGGVRFGRFRGHGSLCDHPHVGIPEP